MAGLGLQVSKISQITPDWWQKYCSDPANVLLKLISRAWFLSGQLWLNLPKI